MDDHNVRKVSTIDGLGLAVHDVGYHHIESIVVKVPRQCGNVASAKTHLMRAIFAFPGGGSASNDQLPDVVGVDESRARQLLDQATARRSFSGGGSSRHDQRGKATTSGRLGKLVFIHRRHALPYASETKLRGTSRYAHASHAGQA